MAALKASLKKFKEDFKEKRHIKYQCSDAAGFLKHYFSTREVPELTKEQKRKIDAFWAEYGVRVRQYGWYRWYTAVADWEAPEGGVDPRFIPLDIFRVVLLPYLNRKKLSYAWKDKNYFDRLLPGMKFPRTFLRHIAGEYYDGDYRHLEGGELQEAFEGLTKEGSVIFKAPDLNRGRGLIKREFASADEAAAFAKEHAGEDYLIQERIKQHPDLAALNESSVNVIRICSLLVNGQTRIIAGSVRVGLKGAVTDVSYVDGVEIVRLIGINEDGTLKKWMFDQNGNRTPAKDVIPNPEMKIPKWDELCEKVKECHKQLPYFRLVGWDMTVTEDDEPVCVEYNIAQPGSILYQYACGPLFGEWTEEALAFLKDEGNQEKYIPDSYRIKKRR